MLSAVGLCRRAGGLTIGFDACCAAVRKGAPLVIIASDAAPRTVRNIRRQCADKTKILYADRTREQFAEVTGKLMAVAAVTNENFARLIEKSADKGRGTE